jgi:hypothetical protein
LLGDLELLLLLTFSEAQPSYIFSWLTSNGYAYKASQKVAEAAKLDEMHGSREALRALLHDEVSRLKLSLETFTKKSESLTEIFTITLLTAPVMLYSLGLFQPWLLPSTTILLIILNTMIIVLYNNLYPKELRIMKLPRKMAICAAYPLLILPVTKLIWPSCAIEILLALLFASSLPPGIAVFVETRRVNRELRENLELLIKASSTPFHIFTYLDPNILKRETKTELSRSVRIATYLMGIWGSEKIGLTELRNVYEELLRTLNSIKAKGTFSALSNLVALFLLGFSSSLVTQLISLFKSREILISIGVTIAFGEVKTWMEIYLAYAPLAYALGLALLSLGSVAFYPMWLPLSSLTALVGYVAGKNIVVGG